MSNVLVRQGSVSSSSLATRTGACYAPVATTRRSGCNERCNVCVNKGFVTLAPSRARVTVSIRVHSFPSLDKGVDRLKDMLDFGKEKRLEVINQFYGKPSRENCESLLSDKMVLKEVGYDKDFSKADYISLVCDSVLPAVPDFSWGHAATGEIDRDGYCLVSVQANGHHTGTPFTMPGVPPLPPSGRHFCLAPEVQKVKVEDGKIVEIEVITAKGAGPKAMYAAMKDPSPPVV